MYTSILRVPKATQTYSTCSDWRPSKNILPHVFLREKLQFTCSTYDLPPLGILSAILGVPNCGATSCTCSSVRVLAHIFPTCSTRCASVLRVPRLLPLLCAPSTLDAGRTRRCAMVAHSPATAAKINLTTTKGSCDNRTGLRLSDTASMRHGTIPWLPPPHRGHAPRPAAAVAAAAAAAVETVPFLAAIRLAQPIAELAATAQPRVSTPMGVSPGGEGGPQPSALATGMYGD